MNLKYIKINVRFIILMEFFKFFKSLGKNRCHALLYSQANIILEKVLAVVIINRCRYLAGLKLMPVVEHIEVRP